jgi:hypothetical protein
MWRLLKGWLLGWALRRTLGGVLAALLMLALPAGFALKLVGVPVPFVLLLVGAPVVAVLAGLGLPAVLVGVSGFAIVGVLFALLKLGLLLLQLALPIVLIVWLVRVLWPHRPPPPPGSPPPPPPPPSPPPAAPPPPSPDFTY